MPDPATPPTTPAATPEAAKPEAKAETPKPDAKPEAKAETPKQTPEEAKVAFEKAWGEWKAPEGFDKAQLRELVDWAQKNGVQPDAAGKIALREQARAKAAEEQYKHMAEKGWLEELQKDPELGGEKSRETMVSVMRAHDKLDPKVQELIKQHGVLYNPIIVRVLHDIGAKMKEDSFVRPGAIPTPEKKQSPFEKLEGMFKSK